VIHERRQILDVAPEFVHLLRLPADRHRRAQHPISPSAGVAAATGATWGLAITGVAGPDGGSAEKPVGLVYIACAGSGKGTANVRVEEHRFSGDREGVRSQAVVAALHALRRGLGL
jgi:nicotinamide-nucleotide amidase